MPSALMLRLSLAKFSLPMTRNLPSVLNRITISPLKTSFDVYIEKILAPPVISMGDVNAAAKPFSPGFAFNA